MTQEKYSFYLPANQINQFNYLMHLPTYYFLLALLINSGKFNGQQIIMVTKDQSGNIM